MQFNYFSLFTLAICLLLLPIQDFCITRTTLKRKYRQSNARVIHMQQSKVGNKGSIDNSLSAKSDRDGQIDPLARRYKRERVNLAALRYFYFFYLHWDVFYRTSWRFLSVCNVCRLSFNSSSRYNIFHDLLHQQFSDRWFYLLEKVELKFWKMYNIWVQRCGIYYILNWKCLWFLFFSYRFCCCPDVLQVTRNLITFSNCNKIK